jgi:hypothetical protein
MDVGGVNEERLVKSTQAESSVGWEGTPGKSLIMMPIGPSLRILMHVLG